MKGANRVILRLLLLPIFPWRSRKKSDLEDHPYKSTALFEGRLISDDGHGSEKLFFSLRSLSKARNEKCSVTNYIICPYVICQREKAKNYSKNYLLLWSSL